MAITVLDDHILGSSKGFIFVAVSSEGEICVFKYHVVEDSVLLGPYAVLTETYNQVK
jgi:hypothetical protein